jgi:hypothetical protein
MRSQLLVAVELREIPPMDAPMLDYESSAFCAMVDGFEIQWLLDPAFDLVGFVTMATEQAIDRWRRSATELAAVRSAAGGPPLPADAESAPTLTVEQDRTRPQFRPPTVTG